MPEHKCAAIKHTCPADDNDTIIWIVLGLAEDAFCWRCGRQVKSEGRVHDHA